MVFTMVRVLHSKMTTDSTVIMVVNVLGIKMENMTGIGSSWGQERFEQGPQNKTNVPFRIQQQKSATSLLSQITIKLQCHVQYL